MNRRGFLGSMLALGAAPAIVRAESLMSLWVPSREVALPTLEETYALAHAGCSLEEVAAQINKIRAMLIQLGLMHQ